MKFLNTQTKNIGVASSILAACYVVSALLGLFRDHLLAGRFGAGNELDVYYAAFTIPDLIALLLVFGAISAAIIPIFTGYLEKSEDEAFEYASTLMNIFLLVLVVVCGMFMVAVPWLVRLVAPGFSPEKMATTAMLMRVMFLSPIILGLSNIVSGMLQVFHRFLVTALAPLMYNVGIIIGIIFFLPQFGLMGLAFGVILGGLLHLCIQVPALLHSGFKYKPLFNFKHAGVVKTLKLMVPRSLGLGAGQLNTIVTTAIASTMAAGTIGVFTLANNLSNMLISAMAVSISTAIFPSLSRAYLQPEKKEFERKFSGAFLQLIFLTLPAAVLLFLLRAQVARVVWGSGKFDWLATRLGAACLGVFALGLCFQGLIFLLSKTFYATHNTKIPAWVSAGTVVCNIAMSFFFVWLLGFSSLFSDAVRVLLSLEGVGSIGILGLVIAYTVTGFLESLLLLFLLYRYYRVFEVSVVITSLAKMVVAALAAAAAAFVVRQGLVDLHIIELQTFLGVLFQLVLAGGVGGVTYLLVAWWLRSPELATIKRSFFKR